MHTQVQSQTAMSLYVILHVHVTLLMLASKILLMTYQSHNIIGGKLTVMQASISVDE